MSENNTKCKHLALNPTRSHFRSCYVYGSSFLFFKIYFGFQPNFLLQTSRTLTISFTSLNIPPCVCKCGILTLTSKECRIGEQGPLAWTALTIAILPGNLHDCSLWKFHLSTLDHNLPSHTCFYLPPALSVTWPRGISGNRQLLTSQSDTGFRGKMKRNHCHNLLCSACDKSTTMVLPCCPIFNVEERKVKAVGLSPL